MPRWLSSALFVVPPELQIERRDRETPVGESIAGEASLGLLEQLRVVIEAPQGLGDLGSDTHERRFGRHLDVKQETDGRV